MPETGQEEQRTPRFQPGDKVRICTGSPPGHFRTPEYIQGKVGVIEAIHGAYRNPETLAYGGDGLPKQFLYLVRFDQTDIWEEYDSSPRDTLLIDVYEHWLEENAER
jgi:nitrile hydratase